MSKHQEQFSPPRGMRDFYPEDMEKRNAIFQAWTTSARRFGFSEYDACVVETLGLLQRKAGEEIVDQIYAFKDKSGRDLALRPEMTPTFARMVGARHSSLVFPLKWFCIAQCFRYERMTRGRKREHYQWNLDVVGESSVSAEAEVLAAALHALEQLGLGREYLQVRFSSRALLSDLLLQLGVQPEFHPATALALDKRGKISDEAVTELLEKAGLDGAGVRKVFRLLEISSLEDVGALVKPGCSSLKEIEHFLDIADAYNMRDRLVFDLSIVRGLAYYTGIVFEAIDTQRKFRAIFGGGRYGNLLGNIAGKSITGVGLGFGDVVLQEILDDLPSHSNNQAAAGTAIGFMQEEQRKTAIAIATHLRKTANRIDLALRVEKAKAFFSRAAKGGFEEAIYIGPDDMASQTVRIKNLATRAERETSLASFPDSC